MTIFSKFAAENVLNDTLDELRLPVSGFHALQHDRPVGRTCLEQALKGLRRLDPRTEAPQIIRLCEELRVLQAECPFPIDWRRAGEIKTLLQERRDCVEDCYFTFQLSELRAGL